MLRFPPRRILVGVDLSEPSLSAWRTAAQWGERLGAEVKAVHARAPEPLDIAGVPRLPGGAEAVARDLKEEFCRRTGAPALEVIEGEPAVALLRIARTWKADLLVLGTHGRTGVGRLLLGSVAESLLESNPVPVLAVHEDPRPIRSILAPVNFTGYSDVAFKYAAAVAASFQARLVAQHVASPEESLPETRVRLERTIRRLPSSLRNACSPRPVVSRGAAAEAISRAGSGYDLIVLSGHHKGFLQALLLGTTAQQVLRSARAPLLVVPEAAGGELSGLACLRSADAARPAV